ncbi:MAG TPA: phage holin family protein [Clostridia bacterium]|nr:phage holin family protein [Clostridia bacterium]
MGETNNISPGIAQLVGRLVRTSVGCLKNRAELLAVEWQEEKARLTELLIWALGLVFLGMMGMVLLTATIIFLFPVQYRIFIAAGFAVLYLAGSAVAWFSLKAHLKREPFVESVDQARKDTLWLESLQ